jgi:hypothetical protein
VKDDHYSGECTIAFFPLSTKSFCAHLSWYAKHKQFKL